MDKKIFLAVIGESNASPEIAKLAEEVGTEIAKAGAVLISGGLKGVMEASCKGCKSGGGTTIGILPGSRREDGNQYIDYPIITGIGVGGHYGTLSEIAFALGYKIPVVGLKTWEMIDHKGQMVKDVHRVNTAKEAVVLALKLAREAKPLAEPSEFNK
jgi:predicted Rossmann-fold nucleotide-binding protein